MKILFHLGHPAHFHLFKNVIHDLESENHTIFIVIKKKDILEDLLINANMKYVNILPDGRKDSKMQIAVGQFKQNTKLYKFCKKVKPDLLVGTSVAISHVGKLLKIPSINFNEDDFDVVPLYGKLAYPWATFIVAPKCCSVGKWFSKKVSYNGYHELAYLHPNRFIPNKEVVEKYFNADETYFVIRLAKLNAHHDFGISGISTELAKKIIQILEKKGKIYITSERKLEPEFEKYRIAINPLDMHHVLSFSALFLGDSQTMSAEAGVLGVPFIRINDFVGKISYLNELENDYKLGFGFLPSQEKEILKTLCDTLSNVDTNSIFQQRRAKMLEDKIDVTAFLVWLFENYPQSVADYQLHQKWPL